MRVFMAYLPGAVEDLALSRLRSNLLVLRPDLEIESSATLARDPAQVRVTPETCEVMLALIDPAWGGVMASATRERGATEAEIITALNRIVPVIPVLLEGAVLPSPVALPAALQGLVLRESVEIHAATLAADLQRLLPLLPAGTATAAGGLAPGAPPPPGGARWLWPLLGLGILAILGTAGLVLLKSRI